MHGHTNIKFTVRTVLWKKDYKNNNQQEQQPTTTTTTTNKQKLIVQLCAPDDGRRNRPKHVEPFRNKLSKTVASCRLQLKNHILTVARKFTARGSIKTSLQCPSRVTVCKGSTTGYLRTLYLQHAIFYISR